MQEKYFIRGNNNNAEQGSRVQLHFGFGFENWVPFLQGSDVSNSDLPDLAKKSLFGPGSEILSLSDFGGNNNLFYFVEKLEKHRNNGYPSYFAFHGNYYLDDTPRFGYNFVNKSACFFVTFKTARYFRNRFG